MLPPQGGSIGRSGGDAWKGDDDTGNIVRKGSNHDMGLDWWGWLYR